MKRLRRAGDRALKTTVEQTLMRGLNTAFPCVRPGLPRSASGRRLRSCRPHNSCEGSPPKPCLRHYAAAEWSSWNLNFTFSFGCPLSVDRSLWGNRLNFPANRPEESGHFACDRSRHQCLTFACSCEASVSCAKSNRMRRLCPITFPVATVVRSRLVEVS
jgi:hypothetical protein